MWYSVTADLLFLHHFSCFKPLTTPSDGSSSHVTGCARSFASISSFQRPSTLVSWSSSSGRQGRRQIPHKPEVMEVEAALVHVSKGLPRTHSLDLGWTRLVRNFLLTVPDGNVLVSWKKLAVFVQRSSQGGRLAESSEGSGIMILGETWHKAESKETSKFFSWNSWTFWMDLFHFYSKRAKKLN